MKDLINILKRGKQSIGFTPNISSVLSTNSKQNTTVGLYPKVRIDSKATPPYRVTTNINSERNNELSI